jgi:Holliday junction resolvase-like predicted endonuclease
MSVAARVLCSLKRVAQRAAARLRRRAPGEAGYRELGQMGESEAARLLRGSGYTILGRNLQVPMGEADILCRDPDRKTVVLVEVKTRLRRTGAPEKSNLVAPEASITAHKRRKLLSIARHLARANGWQKCMRIDVVAVEFDADAPKAGPVVRHHVGAVR